MLKLSGMPGVHACLSSTLIASLLQACCSCVACRAPIALCSGTLNGAFGEWPQVSLDSISATHGEVQPVLEFISRCIPA